MELGLEDTLAAKAFLGLKQKNKVSVKMFLLCLHDLTGLIQQQDITP